MSNPALMERVPRPLLARQEWDYLPSPGAFRVVPGRSVERAWDNDPTSVDAEDEPYRRDDQTPILLEAELVVEPEPPLLVDAVLVPPSPIKRLVSGIRQLVPKKLPSFRRRLSLPGQDPEADSPSSPAESIEPGAYNVRLGAGHDNVHAARAVPVPSDSPGWRTLLQRLVRNRVRVEHQVGGADQSAVQDEVRLVHALIDDVRRQEQSDQAIGEEPSPTPEGQGRDQEQSAAVSTLAGSRVISRDRAEERRLRYLHHTLITSRPSQASSVDGKMYAFSDKRPGGPDHPRGDGTYREASWEAWSDLAQAKNELFGSTRRGENLTLYGGVRRMLFGRKAKGGLIDDDEDDRDEAPRFGADLPVIVNTHLFNFASKSDPYEPPRADSESSAGSNRGPRLGEGTETSSPGPSASLSSEDIARMDRHTLEQQRLTLMQHIQPLSHDEQSLQIGLRRYEDMETQTVKIEKLETSLSQLSHELREARSVMESFEQKLASIHALLEGSTRRESALNLQLRETSEELESCKKALEQEQRESMRIQYDAKAKAELTEQSYQVRLMSLQDELVFAHDTLKNATRENASKSKKIREYSEQIEASKRQSREQLRLIADGHRNEISRLKHSYIEGGKRVLDEVAMSHQARSETSTCQMQALQEQFTHVNDQHDEGAVPPSLNHGVKLKAQFCKSGLDELRAFPLRPHLERPSVSMVSEGSSAESSVSESSLSLNSSSILGPCSEVGFDGPWCDTSDSELDAMSVDGDSEVEFWNLEVVGSLAAMSSESENESFDSADAESDVGRATLHSNFRWLTEPLKGSRSSAVDDQVWSCEGDRAVQDACKVLNRYGVLAKGCLKEEVTLSWSYRHAKWHVEQTALCHTWPIRRGAPVDTMEKVSVQVLRAMIKHLEASSGTSDPKSTAAGIGRFEAVQVLCWQSSLWIMTKTQFIDPQSNESRESIVELLIALVDKTSDHCVASRQMDSTTKKLILTAKGCTGTAGELIWKGGYEDCLKAIQEALVFIPAVETQVACPKCLLEVVPGKASTWSYENLQRIPRGCDLRCERGHQVDSDLVCGACLSSPGAPQRFCLFGPNYDHRFDTVSRSVVLVAVWDPSTGQMELGSGFVIDSHLGLVATSAHVLWNHLDQSNGQVQLDSRKVIRIGVHDAKEGILKFRYIGTVVSTDLHNVDACVIRIVRTKNSSTNCKVPSLRRLKLAKACYEPETVRLYGFNPGGDKIDGTWDPQREVFGTWDPQLEVQNAYVSKKPVPVSDGLDVSSAAGDTRPPTFIPDNFTPRDEAVVIGRRFSCEGQSGGPCVNVAGEVVGILCRVDFCCGLRWYLVPHWDLRRLLRRAQLACKG